MFYPVLLEFWVSWGVCVCCFRECVDRVVVEFTLVSLVAASELFLISAIYICFVCVFLLSFFPNVGVVGIEEMLSFWVCASCCYRMCCPLSAVLSGIVPLLSEIVLLLSGIELLLPGTELLLSRLESYPLRLLIVCLLSLVDIALLLLH